MTRKIFSILALALLVPARLFADDKQIDTMYMDKTAEFNYETQSGVITLENYVPGEMRILKEVKALDIVLVLDFSGSMVGNSGKYTPASGEPTTYDAIETKTYYKYADLSGKSFKFKGGTYSVSRIESGGCRWAYITVGTSRYYLTQDGGFVEAESTTNPTSSSFPKKKSTGQYIFPARSSNTIMFCEYKDAATSTTIDHRIDALRGAVSRFIDLVAQQQSKTQKINRISIIQFQGKNVPSSNYFNSSAKEYLMEYALDSTWLANSKTATYGWQGTSVLKHFTTVDSEENIKTLKHSMMDWNPLGSTASNLGMQMAEAMLNSYARQDTTVAKYVILFSDGKPEAEGGHTWGDGSTYGPTATADAAILNSKTIKQNSTLKTKVYSIYCSSSDPDSNSNMYMDYSSSNYPSASSLTSPGTKKDTSYYKKSKDKLNKVFEDIIGEIIIEVASKYNVSTTLNDFVNNSFFKLPDEVDQTTAYDNILVFENKCTYYDKATNEYSWSETYTPLTKADGINITITKRDTTDKKSNDKIEVSGYDYSKNWCGMDISKDPNEAHGARLVVKIPFVYNKTQVFGDLPTNTDSSRVTVVDSTGTKVDDKPYPIPTLPFCYIKIQKNGLHKGESAIYVISKPDGEFIDKVVINGSGEMVDTCALYGVPGESFRVVETNWNWAYVKTTDTVQVKSVQLDPITGETKYQIFFEFNGAHKNPSGSSEHEREKDPANLHNHDESYKVNRFIIKKTS